jgi:hypothetical protein
MGYQDVAEQRGAVHPDRPARASMPVPRAGTAALAEAIAAAEAALERGDAAAARAAARAARLQAQAEEAGGHWQGQACVFEAVAAQLQFDYPAAFERALEALALLDERQVALRTRALNSCFVVCAESGDLDRALEFSRQAVELAEARGDASGAARGMHNRASLLAYLDEYDAARQCMQEAVARYDALPQEAGYAWFSRVSLAINSLAHARLLERAGDTVAAQARRQFAAEVVPPLRPAASGVPNAAELTALDMWVMVQAELGHLAAARQGLRHYLRLVRLGGRVPRFQAYAVRALAAYHFHAGRIDRGLRLQQAAVARLARAGNRLYQLKAQQRLMEMQAAAGRDGEALGTSRAVRTLRAGLAVEQAGLRSRLSALEWQVRQRLAQQQEALAHQQRLAVIGRLLADIHLALDAPIAGVHAALRGCEQAPLPELDRVLPQVMERIDAAAGLVRQLMMFSYRAGTQGSVVNLHESLREAWNGVMLWRRGPPRELQVSGDLHAQARVDAQRLAVLLRILLIEADRERPAAVLRARIVQGAPHCSVALGDLPAEGVLPDGGAAAHSEAAEAAEAGGDPSVGFTLCREIVQEVAGRLVRSAAGGPGAGFVLQLPAP